MSIENGCIEHQYYQTFARESEDNRVTRLQKDANKTSKWSVFSISFEIKFRSKSFIPERNVFNSEANVLIQKQTFVLSLSHLHLHRYKCANSWIAKTLVWE